MTNEEEKILEEILDEGNDITLEDAAEEAEELQKEDREEIRLDPDEIRERPVLRDGGLRDAADPNMIQKHIDNFLAMLCGETPVDSNVRTSAEYWLKRLAGMAGGASVGAYPRIKKLWTNASPTASFDGQSVSIDMSKYSHIIVLAKFSNSPASYTQSPIFCEVGDSGRISGYGQNLIAFRSFTSSVNSVLFTSTTTLPYTDFSPVTDNSYVIPTEIYGVNF